MTRVNVQIVTYNSAQTLAITLDSLFAQTFTDFRCIVIDNASTDATAAVLAEYPQVVFVRNDANMGYAVGHNIALAHAPMSDYVLTLNPDVWLAPGFLAAMVPVMDADDRLGAIAGQLRRVDRLTDQPQVLDGGGVFMRRTRRQGLRGDGQPFDALPHAPTPIWGPDGAAAFYRRTMLDDIAIEGEVFDADFFMHKEDIDLCWRAQLRGWQALYVPQAIAHHVRTFRPGQRRVGDDLRYYGVRNRYLLMMKNEIFGHWLRDLPFILAYDLAIVAYMLLRERQSLRALRDAWRSRQKMMYKRHIIQERRTATRRDIQRWFS